MKTLKPVARLLAKERQRAVPFVGCYDLKRDPSSVFAIIPIRVVGEEVIQAVGYGDLTAGAPQLAVEHHALSRRTAFLEPFARALQEYLNVMLEKEFPRIILPHPASLEILTILASRYDGSFYGPEDTQASEAVRNLGYHCRLLNELYHTPGQQIVMVMTEAILRHVVTGQHPSKDGHLGALGIWLDPTPGVDTAKAADASAKGHPSAAMLHHQKDKFVEKKLRELKRCKSDTEREHIIREIELRQAEAVRVEWGMLSRAHSAFWGLGLADSANGQLNNLLKRNTDWLEFRLDNLLGKARRKIAMTRLHDDCEYQKPLHAGILVEVDESRFAVARNDGEAFIATIVDVRKRKRKADGPNEIDIAIEWQRKLKLRQRHSIRAIGTNIVGSVKGPIRETQTGSFATLAIRDGIRGARSGMRLKWTKALPPDLRISKMKSGTFQRMHALFGP